jgi:hypothetical protein
MKSCKKCSNPIKLKGANRKFCSHQCYTSYRVVQNQDSLKTCSKCSKTKKKVDFPKSSSGYAYSYCKECKAGFARNANIVFQQKYGMTRSSYAKATSVLSFIEAAVSLAKKRAKHKNREFNIDPAYINELYKIQNGKCALSGLLLEHKVGIGRTHENYNLSIDRIDSTKGYIKGNIQLVCYCINLMKTSLPDNVFIKLCASIVQNRNLI